MGGEWRQPALLVAPLQWSGTSSTTTTTSTSPPLLFPSPDTVKHTKLSMHTYLGVLTYWIGFLEYFSSCFNNKKLKIKYFTVVYYIRHSGVITVVMLGSLSHLTSVISPLLPSLPSLS